MITEYHRPATLEQALKLIRRKKPETRPLGGGTMLAAPAAGAVAAVDLQELNLGKISLKGRNLHIGATTTLQALMDTAGLPVALGAAIRHEATYTLRQTATVAGSLVAADGRSPFAITMLALDAQLELQPKDETLGYGDLLALRAQLQGKLITKIIINSAVLLNYEYVARTPADLPIVALALARWPSGRTRLAVGGWGAAPKLAMDGKGSGGIETAIENALSDAGDQWATVDYRLGVAGALAQRAKAEPA